MWRPLACRARVGRAPDFPPAPRKYATRSKLALLYIRRRSCCCDLWPHLPKPAAPSKENSVVARHHPAAVPLTCMHADARLPARVAAARRRPRHAAQSQRRRSTLPCERPHPLNGTAPRCPLGRNERRASPQCAPFTSCLHSPWNSGQIIAPLRVRRLTLGSPLPRGPPWPRFLYFSRPGMHLVTCERPPARTPSATTRLPASIACSGCCLVRRWWIRACCWPLRVFAVRGRQRPHQACQSDVCAPFAIHLHGPAATSATHAVLLACNANVTRWQGAMPRLSAGRAQGQRATAGDTVDRGPPAGAHGLTHIESDGDIVSTQLTPRAGVDRVRVVIQAAAASGRGRSFKTVAVSGGG